jgi:hypothetical protein
MPALSGEGDTASRVEAQLMGETLFGRASGVLVDAETLVVYDCGNSGLKSHGSRGIERTMRTNQ